MSILDAVIRCIAMNRLVSRLLANSASTGRATEQPERVWLIRHRLSVSSGITINVLMQEAGTMRVTHRYFSNDSVQKLKHLLWPLASVLLLGGCASFQLNENTLDLGGTVDTLVRRQILLNLSRFVENHYAIPAQVNILAGADTTTNSLSASYSDPFSKAITVTNTVASAATTTTTNTNSALRNPKTLTPSATDSWTQTWSLNTITDPDQMRRVRALYRFAVGATIDKADCPKARAKDKTRNGAGTGCLTLQKEYPTPMKLAGSDPGKMAFFPDPTFLVRPGCVLCAPDESKLATPATAVTKEQLVKNDNLTRDWLNWEIVGGPPRLPHSSNEKFLGQYGNVLLWTNDPDQFSQFMMFVLEATSQAAVSGGGGGTKSNSNGSVL